MLDFTNVVILVLSRTDLYDIYYTLTILHHEQLVSMKSDTNSLNILAMKNMIM